MNLTELTGIGVELRQAREERGLAIDDVAQQLKFASRQIESLEAERFDRLPGPTIARGMVRNYARLLKLDAEALVARMTPQVGPPPDSGRLAARFKEPVPFSDVGRRSTFVYAGLSVGILVLVGALAYGWHQERSAPQFVAPAPPQRAEPAPEQAAAAAPVPLAVAEPPPAEPKMEQKAEQKAEHRPEQKQKAEPKAEPKAKPQVVAERPLAPGVHRIVLRCEEEAWLEVRDGTGRTLVSSLNPPGTERVVRARPPFELVIGNPSAVTVTHNGRVVDMAPHIRVGVARFTLQ